MRCKNSSKDTLIANKEEQKNSNFYVTFNDM